MPSRLLSFKGARRFWQTMPTRALPRFFLGVFFTFGAIGFLNDVMNLGVYSSAEIAVWVVLCGLVAVGYAYCNIRSPWLLALVVPVHFGAMGLLLSIGSSRAPLPGPMLRSRMWLDATAAICMVAAGYAFFVSFIVKEGTKQLHFRTEVALAEEIHRVLVPTLAEWTERYEVCGRSFPTTQIGGDLVDVVSKDGILTGYLADVSGHGVPAGTLMGMVKSAARMRLRAGGSLADLLCDLNEVLLPLKKPNMFVTCAAVRLGQEEAEFALAGHLPILHYRRATGTVERLSKGHLPLGILEGQVFETGRATLAEGDILALVSDGLTEVVDARDEEFGIEGIEALLAAHALEELPALFDAVLAAVRAHGPQRDDQSLLLLRALTAPPPLVSIFSLP